MISVAISKLGIWNVELKLYSAYQFSIRYNGYDEREVFGDDKQNLLGLSASSKYHNTVNFKLA